MSNEPLIKGGYVLKPRCEQNSEISHAPPQVRELWNWLILEANHTPGKSSGRMIERGQCVRSYKDIQEGLCWYKGFHKQMYSTSAIENALKWLKKRKMIYKQSTTRGLIITICNYDLYQNPKHYENHTESYFESHSGATMMPNHKQELKKNKKKELIYSSFFDDFWLSGNWVKSGKKDALKSFNKSVKDENDWLNIQKARDNYANHLKLNPWKKAQNGRTWFNNWNDWINWEEENNQESIDWEKIEMSREDYYDQN